MDHLILQSGGNSGAPVSIGGSSECFTKDYGISQGGYHQIWGLLDGSQRCMFSAGFVVSQNSQGPQQAGQAARLWP